MNTSWGQAPLIPPLASLPVTAAWLLLVIGAVLLLSLVLWVLSQAAPPRQGTRAARASRSARPTAPVPLPGRIVREQLEALWAANGGHGRPLDPPDPVRREAWRRLDTVPAAAGALVSRPGSAVTGRVGGPPEAAPDPVAAAPASPLAHGMGQAPPPARPLDAQSGSPPATRPPLAHSTPDLARERLGQAAPPFSHAPASAAAEPPPPGVPTLDPAWASHAQRNPPAVPGPPPPIRARVAEGPPAPASSLPRIVPSRISLGAAFEPEPAAPAAQTGDTADPPPSRVVRSRLGADPVALAGAGGESAETGTPRSGAPTAATPEGSAASGPGSAQAPPVPVEAAAGGQGVGGWTEEALELAGQFGQLLRADAPTRAHLATLLATFEARAAVLEQAPLNWPLEEAIAHLRACLAALDPPVATVTEPLLEVVGTLATPSAPTPADPQPAVLPLEQARLHLQGFGRAQLVVGGQGGYRRSNGKLELVLFLAWQAAWSQTPGGYVERLALVDALWPGEDDDRHQHDLLARTKADLLNDVQRVGGREVGRDWIETDPVAGLRLAAHLTTDLAAFAVVCRRLEAERARLDQEAPLEAQLAEVRAWQAELTGLYQGGLALQFEPPKRWLRQARQTAHKRWGAARLDLARLLERLAAPAEAVELVTEVFLDNPKEPPLRLVVGWVKTLAPGEAEGWVGHVDTAFLARHGQPLAAFSPKLDTLRLSALPAKPGAPGQG